MTSKPRPKSPADETAELIAEGKRLRLEWDARKAAWKPTEEEVERLHAEVDAKLAAAEAARKAKPTRRFTAEEAAELTRPVLPFSEQLPPGQEPLRVAIPLDVPRPESDEAAMERLTAAGLVKQEGKGDPPPRVVLSKLVRVVELDGVERAILVDAAYGGWLNVETRAPRADAPWIAEVEVSRIGIMSIASLSIEDVEPDPAA